MWLFVLFFLPWSRCITLVLGCSLEQCWPGAQDEALVLVKVAHSYSFRSKKGSIRQRRRERNTEWRKVSVREWTRRKAQRKRRVEHNDIYGSWRESNQLFQLTNGCTVKRLKHCKESRGYQGRSGEQGCSNRLKVSSEKPVRMRRLRWLIFEHASE